MKILPEFKCAALAAGALLLAPPASANEDKMQMMDANQDGMISSSEHAAGARKMFETMDANRDGSVTSVEMEAAHGQSASGEPARPQMSSAEKIKTIDANQDGAISAAEHEAGSRAMFGRLDANGDGNLTSAELEAGHPK